MKIAIVDDNEDDRKKLRQEIVKIFNDKKQKKLEITEFLSGEEFIKEINATRENKTKTNVTGAERAEINATGAEKIFDIVFLDIYMNEITGIETAKKLRETDKHSKIIFITTSNEFASESYEVNAYDYLIKPFSKERIHKTIERIFGDEKKNKKIVDLPDGQIIPIDSLLYTTFSGHYVTIYLIDGNKIQLRCTQKNFEKCIEGYRELIQCFKGVTVNLLKVDGIESDRFKMVNGEYIPISRRKYSEVKKLYTDYLIEQLRQGEDI